MQLAAKNTARMASNSDASTFAGPTLAPPAPVNVREVESHDGAVVVTRYATVSSDSPTP